MLDKMLPDHILKYINDYWKPNQDDACVIVAKDSNDYMLLKNAFDYFFKLTQTEQDDATFDVGPFIKIRPYGMFDLEERPNDVEFLFEYESIDRSKLSKQHLMI